jgi:succinyl-CoA synthetase beta subunit
MKIHEYQAKQILAEFGVVIPRGGVAYTSLEAKALAEKLGTYPLVVKAQIHAGGRGKAGGIKLAHSLEEVEPLAQLMLGKKLVTHQTGPEGKEVKRILIEEGVNILRELYLGILLDRSKSRPVIMASTEGGVEIEEVAIRSPEKILKEWVDPTIGIQPFQARKLAYRLQLTPQQAKNATEFILRLYKVFEAKDCSLAEINPLVVTKDDRIVALDAKLNFDDNALYRHEEITQLRDLDEEDPLEVEATRYRLNYIKLDGTVGCMVNGAGLAMATMDIIKLAGASPANFLDVGGGASAEMIENAFRILISDSSVKAVLINIFGGILRCDRLATGVVEAMSKLSVKVPVVIRMEGTNVEDGKRILKESGFNFIIADGMKDAAEKVVKAVMNDE